MQPVSPAGPVPVATPVDGPPPHDATVVYGIPITSPAVAALARKVLGLSFAQALIGLVAGVVGLIVDDTVTSSLIACAVIPFCGVAGVRSKNVRLLHTFALFNLLCCFVFIVSLISTFAISVPMINCLCDDACRASRWQDPPQENVDRICNNKNRILQGYYISCGIGAAAFVLQAFSYYYGKKLSQDSYFQVQALERANQQQMANAPVVYAVGGPVPVQPQQGGVAGGQYFYPPGAIPGRDPTMVMIAPREGQNYSPGGHLRQEQQQPQQQQFAFMNAPSMVGHPQALGVGVPIYFQPQPGQPPIGMTSPVQGEAQGQALAMVPIRPVLEAQQQQQQQQQQQGPSHPFAPYPSPGSGNEFPPTAVPLATPRANVSNSGQHQQRW